MLLILIKVSLLKDTVSNSFKLFILGNCSCEYQYGSLLAGGESFPEVAKPPPCPRLHASSAENHEEWQEEVPTPPGRSGGHTAQDQEDLP